MRTAAWEAEPQIALRDCFKEAVRGRSIYKVLVKAEFNTIKRSFYKIFLLVRRISCHHEGTECFSRYEEMQGLRS